MSTAARGSGTVPAFQSLRRYLGTRLLLLVLPFAAGGMLVHWYFARGLLVEQFERGLVERAGTLATLVTSNGGGFELEFADELVPEYSRAHRPYYFQLRDAAGNSIERSVSLSGSDLPFLVAGLREPRSFESTLGPGRTVRGVSIRYPARIEEPSASTASATARAPSEFSITLAAPIEELDDLLERGIAQVLVTGAASSLAIGVVIWWVLDRAARVLARVVHEVRGFEADPFAKPIDAARTPREIRPIVDALNDAREAIHGHVSRERRFSADVAHELRTPIAELRAAADVALAWPAAADHERLAHDARAIAIHMAGLVGSLLQLASLETTGAAAEEDFDLANLVRECVRPTIGAGASESTVELLVPQVLRTRSDPSLWRIVIRNLLDNALAHAPVGSRIRVELQSASAGPLLVIANPAPELTAQDLERCSERLWRKCAARTSDGHYGLGLSIVNAACARLRCNFGVLLVDGEFSARVEASRQ